MKPRKPRKPGSHKPSRLVSLKRMTAAQFARLCILSDELRETEKASEGSVARDFLEGVYRRLNLVRLDVLMLLSGAARRGKRR